MKFYIIGEKNPHCVVANVLDCDILVSSNSSRAISFTFGLISLVKV